MNSFFRLCAVFLILSTSLSLSGQPVWHLLRAPVQTLPQLQTVLSLDHIRLLEPDSIEWIASQEEHILLIQQQIPHRLVQPDYTRWFQLQGPVQTRSTCDLTHYRPGTMAGYHRYQEVLAELDSMHHHFPHLISAPYPIGQSYEGRNIWAVKLSDYPDLNESATEERVYYDAMTHAREPLSMESLLYYLWWLLENYGTDPQATYLLDHREIFAVPVVNPDGYLYNEQIAPQGGGLWRKNRHPQTNGCVGVDLNRNYTNGWGSGIGASNDPCSDQFEGTASFSEPETQAIHQMIDTLGAATGFSLHSYGPSLLHPFAYQALNQDYARYAEWGSEFVPTGFRGYGIAAVMLNYLASGSTLDYLHTQQTVAWTPEVGLGFWEPADSICKRVRGMLYPMQYVSWIAGSYARLHDLQLQALPGGDTLAVSFRVANRGLHRQAQQVRVRARSLSSALIALDTVAELGDLPARQLRSWTTFPLRFHLQQETPDWNQVGIELSLFQKGVLTDRDTLYCLGSWDTETLFTEDFEQGRAHWIQTGSVSQWDITIIDRHGGNISMTDTPNRNMLSGRTSSLELDSTILLQGPGRYVLQYATKWSLGSGNLRLEVQTDSQAFTPLPGRWTQGSSVPHWSDHHHWTWESVDLSAYSGQAIRLRWTLTAPGVYAADGVYLDDISLPRVRGPTVAVGPELKPPAFELLAADGQWPIYLRLPTGSNRSLSLEYYLPNGQRIFRQSLGGFAPNAPVTLPSVPVQGSLLLVLREEGQWLGSRWLWLNE